MGVILIRHPKAAVAPGVCYGRLDVPLDHQAEAEIATALGLLPRCAALRTSPARRCRALAEPLAARDGCVPEIDPRLQELDFGVWEGQPWHAIDRAESDPWGADPWRVAPPGGETFAALHDRVSRLLAEAPAGSVLVTHAGVIRAARMILLDESFEQVFARPVPYAQPIMLERERA